MNGEKGIKFDYRRVLEYFIFRVERCFRLYGLEEKEEGKDWRVCF